MPVVFFQLWGLFSDALQTYPLQTKQNPRGIPGVCFSYEGGDSELFYYLKSMIPENCEHFVYSF